ncbi:MAG: MOSC domain-containing protein YiiM [Chloroflexi bacterium]|jgi:MOSC domain-containing protein YiiM|nr:MAG: MOSC domain-containing protein YiiM [Chloroflexota bacterium]
MHQNSSSGTIVAVCSSPTSGVPKYPAPEVSVGIHGIDGDFHASPINKHKKSGEEEPNTRHLTIIARESVQTVASELGIQLPPGSIGENVLVEGMGDLAQINVGDILRLGTEVSIKITSQNRPCATLNVYHNNIIKSFLGRRGVTAMVLEIGILRPGDSVELLQT